MRQCPRHAAGGLRLLPAHVRGRGKRMQIQYTFRFSAKKQTSYVSQQFSSPHEYCSTYLCHRLLEQGQYSDVEFLVHGQIFPAHRCILSARSEYFTRMFETKWSEKKLITLKHPLVDKIIFRFINFLLFSLFAFFVTKHLHNPHMKSVLD